MDVAKQSANLTDSSVAIAKHYISLARQGHPNAIAALMRQSLLDTGVIIEVGRTANCLVVIGAADIAPEQAVLVEFVRAGLKKLQPANIDRVIVQGKLKSESRPTWRTSFMLNAEDLSVTQTDSAALRLSPGFMPGMASQGVVADTMADQRMEELLTCSLEPAPANPPRKFSVWAALMPIVFIGGLVSLGLNGWYFQRMQQVSWEYRIEAIEDTSLESTIQQLGAEGWELATTRRIASTDSDLHETVFKRSVAGTLSSPKTQLVESSENTEQPIEFVVAEDVDFQPQQSGVKEDLKMFNLAQLSYYKRNKRFARSISSLQVDIKGLPTETAQYRFVNEAQSHTYSFVVATPKQSDLNSYAGIVFVTAEGKLKTLICESNGPGQEVANLTVVNSGECATGFSAL